MTSKIVMGSASHPPNAAGRDSRNNPASFTLAARSAGIVRLASPSLARERNSGASSAARASTSSRMAVTEPPGSRQRDPYFGSEQRAPDRSDPVRILAVHEDVSGESRGRSGLYCSTCSYALPYQNVGTDVGGRCVWCAV